MVQTPPEQTSPITESDMVCGCTDHFGSQYMNTMIEMEIGYVFECLFGKNKFNERLNASRNVSDLKTDGWQETVEDEKLIKIRNLKYNICVHSTIGTKYMKTTETSRMLAFEADKLYVVDSESISSGVPYSDSFKIRTRICLVRIGENATRIIAHADVIFITNPFGFIKRLIEKNCYSSIAKSYNELGAFFKEETINRQREMSANFSKLAKLSEEESLIDQADSDSNIPLSRSKSSHSSTFSTASTDSGIDGSYFENPSGPRLRSQTMERDEWPNRLPLRQQNSREIHRTASNNSYQYEAVQYKEQSHRNANTATSITRQPSVFETNVSVFLHFFLLIMLILCVFNLMLFMKLKEIETLGELLKDNKFST